MTDVYASYVARLPHTVRWWVRASNRRAAHAFLDSEPWSLCGRAQQVVSPDDWVLAGNERRCKRCAEEASND